MLASILPKFVKPRVCSALMAVTTLLASLTTAQGVGVGGLASNFTVTNIATNQPIRLSDFEGKILVLNFFSDVGQISAPGSRDLEAYVQKYYNGVGGNPSGLPVQVLSVCAGFTSEAQTKAFVATTGLELAAYDNYYDRAWDQFNVTGYTPLYVIINCSAKAANAAQWQLLYKQQEVFDGAAKFQSVINSITAPNLSVEQPAGTKMAAGGSRNFGDVAINKTQSRTFTIKNSGYAALSGLTITKDGADADAFTVTTNPVSPVKGPGGSTTFTVSFAPTVAAACFATLHLASNDVANSPFDISLAGTGVIPVPPVLTWADPAPVNYGAALTATQLNAKASVPGTFVYAPGLGTKLSLGDHTLNVSFTPTDTTHYTPAQSSVTLTVDKAMPVITWANPTAIPYGTALTATQLNAKASVPGTFAYTPVAGTRLPLGTQTLSVVFTPTDTANYTNAQKSVALVVAMANQMITFPAPPALLYGDTDVDLAATASSDLTVSYATSNPAVATIVNGNQLHVVGAGSVKITATQPGDANWKPALAVARTLTIGKKPQTITYPTLTGHTMGDADFSPGATASSGLTVIYASSAPAVATIVAGKIHLVGKGSAVITASQTGNANWAAAPPLKQTLVVAVGSQTISFAPLPQKGVGDVDFAPGATASSGLTVSYVSSNLKVATIVAGKIHVVGNGTSTITAKQAGNASWTAAADAAQTFTVGGKATPVITWANPAAIIYGKPLTATQLNAKANVPGTFAYAPALGTQLPVGPQTLSVTFTPNDQAKYVTAQKSVALTVNKTAATVTLAGLSQGYNGQPRVVTATTVPARLKVVITYAGTTVAPINAASYPVIATIDDPNAAGTKAGTLVVAKANQTITFASLPTMHVGDADYALTASAASGLPVSYASSNPAVATIVGGKVHAVHTGTAVITATQGGDPNWNAALAVKQTLTVPTDDQDIRALYATMKSKLETHDFQGFQALFAQDYLHQGKDLAAQFADPGFITTVKTFAFTITRITVTGSDAQVAGTVTVTFNNGDPAKSWTEPDLTGNSPGIGWLRKTGSDWQVLGDQVAAVVHLATGHNNTPASDHYFFRVRTESSLDITDVTLSGPGIQDTLLAADPDNGGFTSSVDTLPDPLPAVGTKYSFLVRFADSTQAIYQDSVKSWVPKAPVIAVTPGVATATVKWTNVSASVPNASYVWVRVSGADVYWESADLPLTRLSAVFNENGTAQGTLQSGQSYTAEVFIFNKNEDFAYRQLQFTMP
jgi:hypothetical protein